MDRIELQASAAAKWCSVHGCGNAVYGFGFCNKHYQLFKRNGDPLINKRNTRQITGENSYGHIYRRVRGVVKAEHVRIAEAAIGRVLRGTELVHHFDGNPRNNSNSNLVLCPSQAYHFLLHRRQRALDATGDSNKMKCLVCKQWDLPSAMAVYGKNDSRAYHKSCENEYRRVLREKANTTGRNSHGQK